MDEGGGGAANRTNKFYRSTDGGATWSAVTQGSPYPPPVTSTVAATGYFRVITPQIRHMGWGQPARRTQQRSTLRLCSPWNRLRRGRHLLCSLYRQRRYMVSPLKLNTDSGTRAQWMPSTGVTSGGTVFVKWYDRRDTSNNDYWIYGRSSR